ncbi:MAG: TetR/AcrR family transcriptional regulator [Streptomycetaceae bacterium]|nr:TetR/AcrR family transcriptional regulator [Streptomycetaceae bacterium]NUS56279.1 TetR/AcrR family transcriptional regulator [Streptomycetaceae bacterium]
MSGPARRRRIEDAALAVFSAKGYGAASMGEIAEAAGVTRSVLYEHFATKRVLFLTVLGTQNAALVAHMGAAITGRGGRRTRMRATVAAYFDFAEANPTARRLLFDQTDEGDPELSAVRWGIRQTRTRAVMAMMAHDTERAGLDPRSPDAEVLIELLISSLDGVAQWWAHHPDTPRATLETMAADVLWSGLEGLNPRRDPAE